MNNLRHLNGNRTTYNDYISRRYNRHAQPSPRSETNVYRHRRYGVRRLAREAPPSVQPDLTIDNVDLNIPSNTKNHRTKDYDITEKGTHLIIRRGQTFDISIKFNKQYDHNTDDLKLVFLAGDNPSPPKGTRVSLILSNKDEEREWGAWIVTNKDKTLSVRINTPPTCYVGIWKFQVETLKKSDTENTIHVFEYSHGQNIYILFNPWCKDDQVYHPNKDLLEEYVLSDVGRVYKGDKNHIYGKSWVFGQFEENVLDCALYLLDHGSLAWTARGDPVKICRKLSSVTNSNDNNGVLVGNWTEDYRGGKSPVDWIGSPTILNEFFKTKRPVRYGQCWVFSGVMTTLHRALGIPVRSVTNYGSAHDCDGSITIDKYFTESGEPIEELNVEKTWNFHVWNDVWMARPDLPPGYGGWQAVDATPQETSDGVCCCGPAPLEAIKRGEVHLLYDTPFVFAEVNADIVFWEFSSSGDMQKVGINKHSVGKRISTKIPKGSPKVKPEYFCFDEYRQDITDQYKFKEGSEEERTAVITANQHSTMKGLYTEDEIWDVEFKLVEKESMPYGKDYEVVLKINNTSAEIRTIFGRITTSSVHYTGIPASQIRTEKLEEQQIPPKSYTEIVVLVTFDEYYSLLVEQCFIKMSCMCKVLETKQVYTHEDTFRLLKPDIKIQAPYDVKVGEMVTAELSFKNPLPCALTNCKLMVEGPGLWIVNVVPQRVVKIGQMFQTTIELIPERAGLRELVASFSSRQLSMVDGSCEINVVEKLFAP